ncbi:hypothetical protein RclHR1_01370020 [Rhizophagus clarus]|uniref:F-box domain-containing protein n=1 Tax=Rhizophagus clarus TaxID=94130 RepID=A0A2Z6QRB3_9GLOM|nr:hypothetical protein RclHR1_01370020 [Rhizophagus clarus]GES77313.1 hypothetical protein GLOIN_2v1784962 [Rhizophagus clarus]
MFKLNRDVLYLIFKELQHDKKTLFTFLTVNKTWCEMIIPILWKNPLKKYLKKKKSLFNVIISHLSNESRNNLKNQGIDLFIHPYQGPLFNYINCCRHLNLDNLNEIINTICPIFKISTIKKEVIEKEIINLFINENTRITHLYIPCKFKHQMHLIPGARFCFSELEFLSCSTNIYDNVLIGLLEIFKSIKKFEFIVEMDNNNHEIVKLIENSKKLVDIHFLIKYNSSNNHKSFYKVLENSLINHASTIQYFKINRQPTTNILSSFVNLKTLEINGGMSELSWDCLENSYFPFLQVLKARYIPIKSLVKVIESTNGDLNEIKIDDKLHFETDNKIIIQSIYQYCPKLQYLKLVIRENNILELENLLIKCQYLNGLYIIIHNHVFWDCDISFNWDHLFEVLARSSPISLFKFKFYFFETCKFESLTSFLDNWKDRNSMLLQTIQDTTGMCIAGMKWFDLIDYESKGIVKYYNHTLDVNNTLEEFEWVHENI